MPGPTRLQIGLWCAIVVFSAALALWRFDSHPALTVDSAAYVVLAESFFSSEGYGEISYPQGSPPSRFPFGYPLILAPIVAIAPGNFEALRIPSLIATVINASLLFWAWCWLSRRSYWWAITVVAMYCLSPNVVIQGRLVLSEPLFTTFLLGSLILVEYGVQRPRPWPWYIATGALTFIMVYTRSVGLVMLAGMLAYQLYRWRRRFWIEAARLGAVWACCLMLTLALTAIEAKDLYPSSYQQSYMRAAAAPSSEPILDQGNSVIETNYRLVDRLYEHLVRDLPSTILPGLHSDAVVALAYSWQLTSLLHWLAAGIVALLAFGFVRWQRREGWSPLLCVALPYLLFLLPWSWLGPRLLYPIQPQLSLALLYGLEGILVLLLRWLRPGSRSATIKTALAASVIAWVSGNVLVTALYPTHHGYNDFLTRRSQWLQEHTSPEAILMSDVPAIDFLYTRRKAVNYGSNTEISSAEVLWRRLQNDGIDWILVDKTRGTWQVAAEEVKLERVYTYRHSARRILSLLEVLADAGAIVEIPLPDNYQFRAFEVQPSGF